MCSNRAEVGGSCLHARKIAPVLFRILLLNVGLVMQLNGACKPPPHPRAIVSHTKRIHLQSCLTPPFNPRCVEIIRAHIKQRIGSTGLSLHGFVFKKMSIQTLISFFFIWVRDENPSCRALGWRMLPDKTERDYWTLSYPSPDSWKNVNIWRNICERKLRERELIRADSAWQSVSNTPVTLSCWQTFQRRNIYARAVIEELSRRCPCSSCRR